MIVQGESRVKTCFDYAEPQPIMGKSKQEAKNAQAMEQRVQRLSSLRLCRVAIEQGEAKHKNTY